MSEVPTINLFDDDNSSGSFFESFSHGGEGGERPASHSNTNVAPTTTPISNPLVSSDTSSLFGQSDHGANVHHTPFANTNISTNTNTADLFPSSSSSSPSPFSSDSLFGGQSDHSHSFFDSISSESVSPAAHASSHTHPSFAAPQPSFSAPSTSFPPQTYQQTYEPQVSHAPPASPPLTSQSVPTSYPPPSISSPLPSVSPPPPSVSPPLPSIPLPSVSPPPPSVSPPLPSVSPPPPSVSPPLPSVSPPPTSLPSTPPPPAKEMPTQVVTPAGVIDASDHHEASDSLFGNSSHDPTDSLFFESLSLSDASHGHPAPAAPYPTTPPHTPLPTPQSALSAPLPISPFTPHQHQHSESDNPTTSFPASSSHVSLPRRGSGSDLPNAYETHSHLSHGIGPSPLGRNFSYNGLSNLEQTAAASSPSPFAHSSDAAPLSRVNTAPPTASVLTPPPSRPISTSADADNSASPSVEHISPPSPAPSNHINETSPLLVHHNESHSSPSPFATADEHEAPIPHFASGDDDQNIFDSFLGGPQQPDSASFFDSVASSNQHHATPTPSLTHATSSTSSSSSLDHASSAPSATSSSLDHTPSSSSLDHASSSSSLDHSTSANQSYDHSQYYGYNNQYGQDQQYSQYGYNYDYYNNLQYATQDNSNTQYSQYQYDGYGQQYNQQDYNQQHSYPSYPYSSQYSQSTDQSYDQYGHAQSNSQPNQNSTHPDTQHTQSSTQHNQSSTQHTQSNTQHNQSSTQHNQNNTQYNQSNAQYNQQYNQSDAYANQYANQHSNQQYSNNQYNYSSQYNNNQYANNTPAYTANQYTTFSPQPATQPSATSFHSTPSIPSATPAATNYSSWTPQHTGHSDALLFDRPHPVVSFGFCGKMAIFRPSTAFAETRVVRVESVRTVLQRTPFLEPFATYPGPLTSGTSKDAVARWISDRISQSTDDGTTLLWELLRVMSEHYGSLVKSPDASTNPEAAIQKLLIDATEHFDLPAPATPSPASLQEVQQLLLAGNRAEACKVAATTHQWSHALLLAQFSGPEVYANTIANFATTVLPEGSPLRTMYLLYGRQPQEIFRATGQSSALLDKWKANLAAILATSPAQGPANAPQAQPDRRVAAELGDRLWGAQGRVEAAHCCYLLADLPHGTLDNPNTRIVLLGADHKRKRATAATTHQGGFPSNFLVNTDAIIRSEIYEWTKVLGNSQYVLPGIHPYKLAFASLMADLGFPDVAVLYVQQLTATVRAHKGGSQMFTPHYLYQLDTFEERLRGTGAAKALAATGSWLRPFTKGFSGLFGGKGKPAGPSAQAQQPDARAAKKETTPAKKGSNVKPREEVAPPVNSSGLTKEEEEYAMSFSTKKKEPKEGEKPKEEKETKEAKLDDPAKAGMLSRLAFWKKSGTEAKLGDENSFEWNAELKMYVEKGKPLPEPERPPPPPPTMGSYTPSTPSQDYPPPSTPPMMGGPPPTTPPMGGMGGAGGAPPMGAGGGMGAGGEGNKFTSPMASAGGRRKPRYFDSLNDQVYNSKAGSTPSATPDKGNVKIFTPFTPPTTFNPSTPFTPSTPATSSDEPAPPLPPSSSPPPPQY